MFQNEERTERKLWEAQQKHAQERNKERRKETQGVSKRRADKTNDGRHEKTRKGTGSVEPLSDPCRTPVGPLSDPCRTLVGAYNPQKGVALRAISLSWPLSDPCQIPVESVSNPCRIPVGPLATPGRNPGRPLGDPCRSLVEPLSLAPQAVLIQRKGTSLPAGDEWF